MPHPLATPACLSRRAAYHQVSKYFTEIPESYEAEGLKVRVPFLMKYLILSWGIPLAIVMAVRFVTPYSQNPADYDRQTFRPARVWVAEKRGSQGTSSFELRIQSPSGEIFFHRDPEREPIDELDRRVPRNSNLRLIYWPTKLDGNVLMEVTADGDPKATPILSFDAVMRQYAMRRKIVYIAAALWSLFFNGIFFLMLGSASIEQPPRGGGASCLGLKHSRRPARGSRRGPADSQCLS